MAKAFNDNNINEVIASGKPVVVDFWAEWCGPCKAVSPIIDELAQEYEGKVEIGKYDVDEGGDFMAEYGIRNIPTILFFNNGELKDRNGKTVLDKDGNPQMVEVFNFGKHKGLPVADVLRMDPGYYSWILAGDFTYNTKQVLTRIRLREAKMNG